VRTLRDRGRRLFIPFLTAGFPDPSTFARLLERTGGCDLVEIGLPFSDPVADGPTIQRASEAALAHGMHAERLFDVLAAGPRRPPVVLMTYLNPVLAYGSEAFMRRAAACGVQGLLLTDVPVEESGALVLLAAEHGIATVQLVAPTTPAPRIGAIAAAATGFLYCVAVAGTTGARATLGAAARSTVERVRQATSLPVVVGFGISTPEQVRAACAFADGVVVGSALVDFIARHRDAPDLAERFEAELGRLAAATRV
jgi:tryptophan synthase alpha chain